MAIEIVDFPMKHGDCPVRYVSHNQRVNTIKPVDSSDELSAFWKQEAAPDHVPPQRTASRSEAGTQGPRDPGTQGPATGT